MWESGVGGATETAFLRGSPAEEVGNMKHLDTCVTYFYEKKSAHTTYQANPNPCECLLQPSRSHNEKELCPRGPAMYREMGSGPKAV